VWAGKGQVYRMGAGWAKLWLGSQAAAFPDWRNLA